MSVLSGDYIGFTYNGIHSSELGLVRVSNGSRYDESLLPVSQDKVVQVPGGDGSYFFGSYYTSRVFSVLVAFDSLTETQLRRIKQVFGDKKVHSLSFDELPYKVYSAKVTGTASIKYLAFSEGKTQRLYKGEGEIQFTAFNSFARVNKKFLNEYSEANKGEWAEASGLLQAQGDYDILSGNKIKIYNPGDLECDWTLEVNFKNGIIPATSIKLEGNILGLNQITAKGTDNFVKIVSKTNLIEGYVVRDGVSFKSGNIYNEYIRNGEFFKIPQTLIGLQENNHSFMVFDNANNFIECLKEKPLEYSYYYF